MSGPEGRIPDSLLQKATKLKEEGADLLRELREIGIQDLRATSVVDLVDRVLPIVLQGSLQALGTFASTLLQDPDCQERLRIHTIVGNVLAEELHISPEAGKVASYYLMGSSQINDLAINGQLPPPPPKEWLEVIEKALLSVTLRYEQRPARPVSSSNLYREKSKSAFVSIIEIYLLRPGDRLGDGPVRKELTSEVAFENMLASAREEWIRNRQSAVYKLFPGRTE